MGFSNYLTSAKLQIKQHVLRTFKFTDTSALTEAEIKAYVDMLCSSAIPIPSETYAWLANMFKYIQDKDNMLVYDHSRGLWEFYRDDTLLRNVLTDYFTIIAEEAEKKRDKILMRYARVFFAPGKIPNLSTRIKTAVHFLIRRSSDVISQTEHLRYFNTTEGTRALLDLSKPSFNLRTVSLPDTQPLMLTQLASIPINTTDEDPTLWLSLIEEYMLHDPVKIEYFHKVLAYMMAPYNYNQALLYFYGSEGRNGKGTVMKVLLDILGYSAAMLTPDIIDANPPVSFKKDDALKSTEGKSLLIFNELDERMIASTQNIKTLTEGGRDKFGNKIMTTVRPAYSKNYDINISGIPLLIANRLINFGDWSALGPIFKRLVLVSFDFLIVKEDPTIADRLAMEYPKIQLWLYRNYFKYKDIVIKDEPKPLSFALLVETYRADSDIISLFWDNCLLATGSNADRMLRADIYRMYEQFCEANGKKAIKNIGTNGFATLIKKRLEKFQTVNSGGAHYICGIKQSPYFEKEIKPF